MNTERTFFEKKLKILNIIQDCIFIIYFTDYFSRNYHQDIICRLFSLFSSKILQLEEEYIKRVCGEIIAHKPDLVFTEKGVSGSFCLWSLLYSVHVCNFIAILIEKFVLPFI